ncbi:MAG: hypothetical protein MRJ93_14795 [Nitrososphaeraceae archaeon]|nr:hypothetical protein [Nitrososphaeraceae archaeon]
MNKDTIFINIRNNELKKAILIAMADETSKAILDATIDKPKRVEDVIVEKNIPRTSAYRKVGWLLSKQLLCIEKMERNIINESRYLHSRFIKILIQYRQGVIEIEAVPNKKICGL